MVWLFVDSGEYPKYNRCSCKIEWKTSVVKDGAAAMKIKYILLVIMLVFVGAIVLQSKLSGILNDNKGEIKGQLYCGYDRPQGQMNPLLVGLKKIVILVLPTISDKEISDSQNQYPEEFQAKVFGENLKKRFETALTPKYVNNDGQFTRCYYRANQPVELLFKEDLVDPNNIKALKEKGTLLVIIRRNSNRWTKYNMNKLHTRRLVLPTDNFAISATLERSDMDIPLEKKTWNVFALDWMSPDSPNAGIVSDFVLDTINRNIFGETNGFLSEPE